jgi:hypothetical protein
MRIVGQFGAFPFFKYQGSRSSCFLGRILPDYFTGFQHADMIGDFKRTLGALFDEKDGQPVFFQLNDRFITDVDHLWH